MRQTARIYLERKHYLPARREGMRYQRRHLPVHERTPHTPMVPQKHDPDRPGRTPAWDRPIEDAADQSSSSGSSSDGGSSSGSSSS